MTTLATPITEETRRALYRGGIAPCEGCKENCLVAAAAELGYSYPVSICPFPPGEDDTSPNWPRSW